jgi:hypothetical protein
VGYTHSTGAINSGGSRPTLIGTNLLINLEICQAQRNRGFISQLAKALEKGLYSRSEDPGLYTLYYNVMSKLASDTHSKMEALQIELWRQASPIHKMNQLAQLNAAARLLAQTGLRAQYPQASESELRFKLASLLLGDELANKVYGEPEDAE